MCEKNYEFEKDRIIYKWVELFLKKNQNNSHMACDPYFVCDKCRTSCKQTFKIDLKHFVFLQKVRYKLTIKIRQRVKIVQICVLGIRSPYSNDQIF